MAPPTEQADAAGDDSGDPDDRAEVTVEKASRRGALVAVLTAMAVVFGLAAAVLTASYVRLRSDRDSDEAARTKVATTATQVVEAMFVVDANGDNKAESDVVHALGTGPLINQYDTVIPKTRQLLQTLSVSSERGQVTDNGVYIGDISGSEAQAVVVIDLVVVGQVTKVVPSQYLQVHLVKLDGTWKVDNIENVNVALAASAGQQTPSTPTSSSSSG